MRKVFLEDLPHYSNGKYKGKINWKESVGKNVKFINEDIEGYIDILEYDSSKQQLKVRYENKTLNMLTGTLLRSGITKLTSCGHRQPFKYKVGDIVNNNKVLKVFRVNYRGATYKRYEFQCLSCGYVGEKYERDLEKKQCPICSKGRFVHPDINSIKVTHPNVYNLIIDSDADKYSYGSDHKVHWKCPFCKKINFTAIKNLTSNKPTGCQFCGDGVSYPEKILYNVFSFVSDTFEKHKCFEWSEGRAYDAFDMNIFTEIHGSQHYIKSFEKCGGRTLEEEIENDKYKHKLAINNHKNIVDYVVIKAYPETFDNIKQAILNSKLTKYYNFSKVDWDYVRKQAESSLVVEVGERYNIDSSIQNLSEYFQIDKSTVYSYLRKATKLEICNFVPRHNGYRVRCRNTNEIFESMTQAAKWCNTQREYISECLKGIRENAGFHPITKEALLWELVA